eukprot:1826406-Pyramimonas_sp.AAC.1
MRGRMNVNVVRARRTPKPPRRRSRNRAIRLSRETRVIQVASPCASDQHGGRIWVAVERKDHELPGRDRLRSEQPRRRATAPSKFAVQPWTVPCYIPTRVDDG